MERFIHYVFIISLTLLFILIGGFFADTEGMLSALLVSISIYTSIYIYKREKNNINLAAEKNIKVNEEDALYDMVHRLVKRTDIEIPIDSIPKEKNRRMTYGTI